MLDSSYKSLLWGSSVWKQTCFMRSISESIFVPGRRHCTEPARRFAQHASHAGLSAAHSQPVLEGPAPPVPGSCPIVGRGSPIRQSPSAASGPR